MESTSNPTVSFLGLDFDLTILAMSLLAVTIVFVLVFWASRKMTLKPKGKQNVLEYVFELVNSTIKQNLGGYTNNYSLLMFVIFGFVLTSNMIGLLTKLETKDYNFWTSPTANFGVTLTLSLLIAVVCHVEGIRKRGFLGYLKGFLEPMPGMLPMNILEELTNVASLALRLFGNIYSGEVVMSLILELAKVNAFTGPIAFIINIAWTAFSVFIGFIQAYVFIILSSSYISNKVNGEE
ncbi:F0F1 ATP synthase subunit A [Streptococcus sp. HF-1907]|uniref:F0F1 ATP synthase subunit A n=1 Tax=Streptococcus sp. HF-1907 TaxID=2785793 RepID=UPI00189D5C6A|nr:F0F1 ATP synthase subunit A [Streptococcus sp. HF-1907]MBF7093901.1 F0F1 ATP synthase subunit A [Streptococcus sp. HF-1907]